MMQATIRVRQLQAIHLFPELAGVDATAVSVEHVAREGVHLLDLQEAASDARPEGGLGQLLEEDELGLEDPAEVAVRAGKTVRRTESREPPQRNRGGGVSGLQRGVEMPEAIPLVGDPTRVNLPVRSAHEAPEDAVVTGVDTVESLLCDAPNPRAEAPAEHRERGKVDVGVAVGVGVVLLEREVALVVEEAVQDGGRVPIRALDGRAEERGVVVGDETVELEGEVAEPPDCRSSEGPSVAASTVTASPVLGQRAGAATREAPENG